MVRGHCNYYGAPTNARALAMSPASRTRRHRQLQGEASELDGSSTRPSASPLFPRRPASFTPAERTLRLSVDRRWSRCGNCLRGSSFSGAAQRAVPTGILLPGTGNVKLKCGMNCGVRLGLGLREPVYPAARRSGFSTSSRSRSPRSLP